MLGGQRVYVLDLDAEYNSHTNRTETYQTFPETAEEEVKECVKEGISSKFLNIYTEYCMTFHTSTADQALRLCLTGASYIYNSMVRKMRATNALMVFYRKNGKYYPLWDIRHFQTRSSYIFLDVKELKKRLHKVFDRFELKLGSLTTMNLPAIAWQITTDEGIFYIPWHSGAIVEKTEDFTFEEKTLEEMKKTYTLLRFAPSYEKDIYKIVCC